MSTILFIVVIIILFVMLPELAFILVIIGAPIGLMLYGNNLQKRTQITDFRCSEQQISLVQAETDYCVQVGGDGAKCFAQAKITICDKILDKAIKNIPKQ